MVPGKHLQAEILWREDYAPDLWSIRIRPEQPMAFRPGQYATLGVHEHGKIWERPYSIVSSPDERDLEFFFELVTLGDLTPLLYKLQTGDRLFVRPACKGLFTFDGKSGRKRHLMVATVTGVAPFVSMVRSLVRQPEPGHDLYVLQGASRSWEFAYARELLQAACVHPWLKYIPTVSRFWEDPDWDGEIGRVDDVLRKYTDQLRLTAEDTTAYLCGHPTMIANVRGVLERIGFAKDSIREEIYFVLKP